MCLRHLLVGKDNNPQVEFGKHSYPCLNAGMTSRMIDLQVSVYVGEVPSQTIECEVAPVWPRCADSLHGLRTPHLPVNLLRKNLLSGTAAVPPPVELQNDPLTHVTDITVDASHRVVPLGFLFGNHLQPAVNRHMGINNIGKVFYPPEGSSRFVHPERFHDT
ncbi:MAG: hypothetical protein BWY89_00798 [Bacteroidetes bacterium ADurb.BinA012]|nr:MAG: hypothetical protein BWY89_00798 [Bacteroidetes bacterium ADurb.BinA012]